MAPDISKLDADRQLLKSELEHDSLPRKAYTTISFWRPSPDCHDLPASASATVVPDPPVARRDGASLEDFTGEYAWMGARNVGTVTDKEVDSTSGHFVSIVPSP